MEMFHYTRAQRRDIQRGNTRQLLNFDHVEEKTIHIIEVFMFFLCKSYILGNLYHLLLCFLYVSI
jgi:hypothetical protein